MPFDTLEESIEDGRPLRLYRFSLNDKTWRYTSADGDVTKAGQLWVATPIQDEGVAQTGEASTDAFQIIGNTSMIPAQLYMNYPPARPVQVAVFDAQEEDDEIRAVYAGEITQLNVPQPGRAVFTCETVAASMEREGLRLGWQRSCPYALYDVLTCKVPKSSYGVACTVIDIGDNVVAVAELAAVPSGTYAGGFVEWVDSVRGIERRTIESQSGGVLTMFGSAAGITEGLVITAYPGCDRTTGSTGCSRFSNLDNYGGAPGLMGKSPFDGSPVFT